MLTEYCKNPSDEGRDKADSLVRVGEEDSCRLLNVLLNQGQLPQVHQGGCKGKEGKRDEGGTRRRGTGGGNEGGGGKEVIDSFEQTRCIQGCSINTAVIH